MAPPKGIRIGGRQKGTPNKATAERERAIAEAAGRPVPIGQRLGIDYMRDAVKQFYALAARYQKGSADYNEEKFAKYMKLVHDCGYDIAQFETPKLGILAVKQFGEPLRPEDLSNESLDAIERVLDELRISRSGLGENPGREIKTVN